MYPADIPHRMTDICDKRQGSSCQIVSDNIDIAIDYIDGVYIIYDITFLANLLPDYYFYESIFCIVSRQTGYSVAQSGVHLDVLIMVDYNTRNVDLLILYRLMHTIFYVS